MNQQSKSVHSTQNLWTRRDNIGFKGTNMSHQQRTPGPVRRTNPALQNKQTASNNNRIYIKPNSFVVDLTNVNDTRWINNSSQICLSRTQVTPNNMQCQRSSTNQQSKIQNNPKQTIFKPTNQKSWTSTNQDSTNQNNQTRETFTNIQSPKGSDNITCVDHPNQQARNSINGSTDNFSQNLKTQIDQQSISITNQSDNHNNYRSQNTINPSVSVSCVQSPGNPFSQHLQNSINHKPNNSTNQFPSVTTDQPSERTQKPVPKPVNNKLQVNINNQQSINSTNNPKTNKIIRSPRKQTNKFSPKLNNQKSNNATNHLSRVDSLNTTESHADQSPENSSNETLNGSPSSNPVQIPTDQNSSLHIQENLNSDTTVMLDFLKCDNCQKWMSSEDVHCCNCKLVCVQCSLITATCEHCGLQLTVDTRVSNLHKRMASIIPHPCRYTHCPHIVRPGDSHETNCMYRPFRCYKCMQDVPIAEAMEHFKSNHPDQVPLGDTNCNVLYTDFWINHEGKQVIYCITPGHMLWINLLKHNEESDAQFLINPVLNSEDNLNTSVKFEFKFNHYTCVRVTKLNGSLQFVDVPVGVINDWQQHQCKLDIHVTVRKKRKMTGTNNESKKKKKKNCQ